MIKIKNAGFTIVELMVTVAIMAALFGIVGLSISRLPSASSATKTYDILVSDLRSQQTQAMASFTGGGAADSYGIHFDSTGYTLFKGSSYIQGTPSNFVTTLDPTVSFTNITVPGGTIVFTKGSGDVAGYIAGSDSVTIANTQTGENKVLRINKYGATY